MQWIQQYINYMRKEYNLLIGDSTAEKIKKEMGTAIATGTNTYPVKGRDLRSGTPKEVNITEEDTAEALNDIMKEMINAIKQALENTPPELSADLVDMGLTLTGGGALLKNIDKRFSKKLDYLFMLQMIHYLVLPLGLVKLWIKKKLFLLCYLNIKRWLKGRDDFVIALRSAFFKKKEINKSFH